MQNKQELIHKARIALYKKTLSNWVDRNDDSTVDDFLKFNAPLSHELFGSNYLHEFALFLKNKIHKKITARQCSQLLLTSDETLRNAGYAVKLSYNPRKKSSEYVVSFTYPSDFQEVAKRGLTFQIGQAYVKSDAFDIISFHNLDMQNSKASKKD
jgi:hypothetical protein